MHNLATIVDRLKRYDEAEQLYLKTIQGKAKVLGPTHPSTNRTMQRLAEMYERWGKPREGGGMAREAAVMKVRKLKVQELTVQSCSSRVPV